MRVELKVPAYCNASFRCAASCTAQTHSATHLPLLRSCVGATASRSRLIRARHLQIRIRRMGFKIGVSYHTRLATTRSCTLTAITGVNHSCQFIAGQFHTNVTVESSHPFQGHLKTTALLQNMYRRPNCPTERETVVRASYSDCTALEIERLAVGIHFIMFMLRDWFFGVLVD